MSNYSKITNFAAKDALASGNPLKIVTGTGLDNEFNAISVAIASKADTANPTFTTPHLGTAAADALTVTGVTQLNSTLTTTLSIGGTANQGFPVGTRLAFNQTAAPTGWTKDTTAALNDSAMRIVTGTVGSGGSNAFSTAAYTPTISVSGTIGGTALTIAQLPSHSHSQYIWSGLGGSTRYEAASVNTDGFANITSATSTGAQGSGQTHTHSFSGSGSSSAITLGIKYNDFIIATKDA